MPLQARGLPARRGHLFRTALPHCHAADRALGKKEFTTVRATWAGRRTGRTCGKVTDYENLYWVAPVRLFGLIRDAHNADCGSYNSRTARAYTDPAPQMPFVPVRRNKIE